ncbi:MAG: TetR family transcriptional regulator [Mycolicibacterium sp.]|nr:TetR family transcriptional regulator [Mycolicibacterium sp.]
MARWQPGSRERLQGAALELFSEQGFERTTVAEIADRVGVTTRTFFRHFADKRDVLFAESEPLERLLADATAGAPVELAPLDAITAAIAGLDWQGIAPREAQRQRQMVIAASPELTERELIKLDALTAAFASGLRRRGTEETTALLAAQAGLIVLRTAHRRWIDADTETEIAHIIDAVLADLRAIVTASSPTGVIADRCMELTPPRVFPG